MEYFQGAWFVNNSVAYLPGARAGILRFHSNPADFRNRPDERYCSRSRLFDKSPRLWVLPGPIEYSGSGAGARNRQDQ
jgi:hypothetical protein